MILESNEMDIRILGVKCLGDQLEIFTNSEIQSEILNDSPNDSAKGNISFSRKIT